MSGGMDALAIPATCPIGLHLLCMCVCPPYGLAAGQAHSVVPLAEWLGSAGAAAWCWGLAPTLSYVGQGAIMGPRTCTPRCNPLAPCTPLPTPSPIPSYRCCCVAAHPMAIPVSDS
jgi:hypothetical protein